MADRAKKKQKQRLKREEKRARHHKLANLSPFKKVAMFSNVSACYVNGDWRERGQATGYVVREMRDGSLAIASFLIDLWCAGLKDIWAKFDLYADEVNGAVKRTSENMDTTMVRVSLEEIRRLLAGSIRFARQNGFRLPAELDKCLAFVGGVDSANADLAGFGHLGDQTKLMWAAPLSDLRKRLIGCTVEEFLARENVDYIAQLDDEDFDETDEDEDERFERLMDKFAEFSYRAADEIAKWIRAQGESPSARLRDAYQLCLSRTLNDFAQEEKDEVLQDVVATLVEDAVGTAVMSLDELPGEIKDGMGQVQRWIASFATAEDAFNHIGNLVQGQDD